MRHLVLLAAATSVAGAVSLAAVTAAQATVHVAIDLTNQSMHVDSARGSYDWPISSARSGFSTPGGNYAPTHLELMHYSKKYHMSPMPHAIFFSGGYAIHGTYATGELGRPASHGCVRLSPGHAAALYDMVRTEGARISISGTPPESRPFYAEGRRHGARVDVADGREDGYGDGYADAPYAPRSRRGSRAYYGLAGGYSYAYPAVPQYRYGYGSMYGAAPMASSPLLGADLFSGY